MNAQYKVTDDNIFYKGKRTLRNAICIFYYAPEEDINLIEGRKGVIIVDLEKYLILHMDAIKSHISNNGHVVIRELEFQYV